jgi:hypothetical protein
MRRIQFMSIEPFAARGIAIFPIEAGKSKRGYLPAEKLLCDAWRSWLVLCAACRLLGTFRFCFVANCLRDDLAAIDTRL